MQLSQLFRAMQDGFALLCVAGTVLASGVLATKAWNARAENTELMDALRSPIHAGTLELFPHLETLSGESLEARSPRPRVVMIVDDYCAPCSAVATGAWTKLIEDLRNAPAEFVFVTVGSPAAFRGLAAAADAARAPYTSARVKEPSEFGLRTGIRAVPILLVLGEDGDLRLVSQGQHQTQSSELLAVLRAKPRSLVYNRDANSRGLAAVHGVDAGEQCTPYSPASLTVVDAAEKGFELRAGDTVLQLLDTRADADAAKAVAARHFFKCSLTSGGRQVMVYWKSRPTLDAAKDFESAEDCLPYNAGQLEVQQQSDRWKLVAGPRLMAQFDSEETAYRALNVASRYSAHCFIGRRTQRQPRADYVFEYWK